MRLGLDTIYLVCAIAGGTILVIRMIMMIAGLDQGDAAAGADVSLDLDGDGMLDGSNGGLNFLSLQSIAGFFTMFGLVGLGLLQVGAASGWSLAGALAAGGITAWATAFIFLKMQGLQSEGTLVISNAVGKVGTVYLTIPEKSSGVVTVSVQGTMRSLDAVAEHGQKIPTGTIVRVVGITAGKILVVTEQTTEH